MNDLKYYRRSIMHYRFLKQIYIINFNFNINDYMVREDKIY